MTTAATTRQEGERRLEDNMDCKHTAIRCTNNRFFCLLCGAEIEPQKPQEEKPAEKPKPAPKRTRKPKAD